MADIRWQPLAVACRWKTATASARLLLCSMLCIGQILVHAEPAGAEPAIESVRVSRAAEKTRLVFDLSEHADHKIFELSNPNRLVIDLEPAAFNANLAGLALENTPVRRIRTGDRDGGGLRVVIDLKSKVKPNSLSLSPDEKFGHRLVIDLHDSEKVVETSISDVVEVDRDIVIAVDAGHGGHDPGASGPGGIVEKQVVMAISRQLGAMIDRHPGYRAELIRTGDYFVPLSQRRDLARRKGVDLFVSIHADAFHNPSVRGASVYALSGKGATSERRRYATGEATDPDLIGGSGRVELDGHSADVVGVLLDLSMNSTMDTSLQAGERVLSEIGAITKLHKKSVKQQSFLVLKSLDVPSLLIETGFISNAEDARKLSTKLFQEKMARAIFNGIRGHYAIHPPAGTLIAAKGDANPEVYLIKSGDTLSEIAKRYNVSLTSLKAVNQIDGSAIKVGQKLQIPNS